MSPKGNFFPRVVASVICAVPLLCSGAVVFTNDTTINSFDTQYEQADVVVSNCTLTVDGPHAFATLLVGAGATLTHTFSATGFWSITRMITDEAQILSGVNPVTLSNAGTLVTYSVTDTAKSVTYTDTVDYAVSTLTGNVIQLQRTTNSTIPDGATVLVSYSLSSSTPTGLNLSVTGAVVVASGGAINVNGRGYGAGYGTGQGHTSSYSPNDGSGGGYGGIGGLSTSNATAGLVYGAFDTPTNLGSPGGSGAGGSGASGGGALRLAAGSSLVIDGLISANGADATNSRAGGGSGGSIWITAQNITGAGSLSANGGAGEPIHGGGGGGGRIFLQCLSNGIAGPITAYGGNGWQNGGAGTIYNSWLSQPGLLTLDNGGHAGANSTLTVVNNADVLIRGNASAITASSSWNAKNITVASNSFLLAQPGVNLTLNAAAGVTIQSGGGVLADSAGSGPGSGSGPGRPYGLSPYYPCGGGGYGGYGASGANTNAFGGIAYVGQQSSPTLWGSGGGNQSSSVGGWGGGAIRLNVNGTLRVDGRLSANGGNGTGTGGGGGSGGSLWVTAGSLTGLGTISVNGGNGADGMGGGGGGGRMAISIIQGVNSFAGSYTAFGGGGANWGGAGTIFVQTVGQNAQLILDNGSHPGTNSTFYSSGSTDLILRNGAVALENFPPLTFASLFIGSNAWLVAATYGGNSSPGIVNMTVLGNATLQAGGGIITDAYGYPANQGPGTGHAYPGGSTYYGGGGGHGGYGANATGVTSPYIASGGNANDSTTAPTSLGSGGGSSGSPGAGAGGGSVRLVVNGTLQLDGKISANGSAGSFSSSSVSGGGSGGSIWMSLGKFLGAGSISANGGNALPFAGGGGGGRIAITFNTNLFTGPITAYGGTNWGGAGTIYLKTNSQSIAQLIFDNGGNPGTNSTFDVGQADATISGGASVLGGSFLRNLLIRSNGVLTLGIPNLGQSQMTISGSATIDRGGAINADGTGYAYSSGPGAGSSGTKGGGGHGGYGGGNLFFGGFAGNAYDSVVAPNQPGSGGAGSGTSIAPFGGAGGGQLNLQVAGTLTVNGRLSANGKDGDDNAGGGAGGSIWLSSAGLLTGSGSISANGGAGYGIGGGGGGGRISLNYTSNSFSGTITASGGNGLVAGGAGTIYTKPTTAPVGQLLVDNGGLSGTNTPLSSTYSLPTLPFNLTISGGSSVAAASLPLLSNLTVGAGSRLTALSSQTNLVLAVLQNLNVGSNGVISVAGLGFARGNGPGAGASTSNKGAGGGYGGAGGASASLAPGGTNYGSAAKPVDRGSGGGTGANAFFGGSDGGGALRLSVGGALLLNGAITADGNPGLQDDSGGGSGGSVWLSANSFTGNGSLSANGGPGDLYGGGGGGGGRLAIYSPANTFTGLVSVLAGNGATSGQPGTIFLATNFSDFQIVSQTPVGTVSNVVGYVDLTFNDAVAPASVTSSAFSLLTPAGSLPSPNLAASATGVSTVRVTFPTQNAVGDYMLQVSTGLASVVGQPLSQIYTGSFTVVLPTISGFVTDTNGNPVAGVLLQPASGGLGGATTDASGKYNLGIPSGWTGNVVPSLANSMFIPSFLSYTNFSGSLTNQNFIMVPTIAPLLSSGTAGTNVYLRWRGLGGVSYQPFVSTNLTDWQPLGGILPGSNALMELLLPRDYPPAAYFRVQATD